MGAHRNVALTELPFRGISINPASGYSNTINVVASDSGIIFVNKNASYDTTYNLPAVADAKGKMFWFFAGQYANNVVINAPTSTLVMANSLVANSTTNTTTPSIGDCGFVICDGDKYYFFEIYGDWSATT